MNGINKTQFTTKQLICCDCGAPFTFSIGEQLYFKSKQLSQPRRCPECRLKRKLTLVPDRGGAE